MKLWTKIALAVFGLALASWGSCPVYVGSGERYDTLQSGSVVLTRTSAPVLPKAAASRDTVAVSSPASFKTYLSAALHDSASVFVGRIDSVIEKQFVKGDTTVPGLSVSLTLNPKDTSVVGSRDYPFYFRLRVDTVVQGSLPSKLFWVKSFKSPSCAASYSSYRNQRFVNLSGGFQVASDLKLPVVSDYLSGSSIVPDAHWFDGRYLVSPKFPGLRIDIREVLPAYPVALLRRANAASAPLATGSKWVRPDGRRASPASAGAGKVPAPLFRR